MCSTTCWCSHLLKPLNSLRIYFYWICRGQEEFDWFCDLLSDAAEVPQRGSLTLLYSWPVRLSFPKWALSFHVVLRICRQFVLRMREPKMMIHWGEETSLCSWPVLWATKLGSYLQAKSWQAQGSAHWCLFVWFTHHWRGAVSREHQEFWLGRHPGGTRFSFFKENF